MPRLYIRIFCPIPAVIIYQRMTIFDMKYSTTQKVIYFGEAVSQRLSERYCSKLYNTYHARIDFLWTAEDAATYSHRALLNDTRREKVSYCIKTMTGTTVPVRKLIESGLVNGKEDGT